MDEVQKIMNVADQEGLTIIKNICKSKLGQAGDTEDHVSLPSTDSG